MISRIHSHIHHGRNSVFHDKMPTTLEYIQGLEDERRKIQVFERELPLCLQLVTEAIECKQKLLGKEGVYNISDCSEQTSTDGPILEEFISLKRSSSSDYDDQHSQNIKEKNNNIEVHKNNDKAVSKKSDWLRSAQLWNQTSDPAPTENDSSKGVSVMEVNKNGIGGAFHPFKREKVFGRSDGPLLPATTGNSSPTPAAAASSTAETGGSNGGKSKMGEKKSQSQRKTRRSWSPELHKRFLRALKQLGGSNVATPKQIRELMKVDGLTNDEVKSHLRKYRLHNRRSNPSIHNNHPQQTQFVVVGGIWVPPPEDAAAMATTNSGEATGGASSNEIYAPIATLATHFQDESASAKLIHRQHGVSGLVGQESNCGGGADSDHNYQASSSSTDTVTTSQD